MKLLIPNVAIFLHTLAFNFKLSFVNFIDLNFLIYTIFKANVNTWLTNVDIAAPSTPLLKTKINTGSNIVFNIAPLTIDIIEYLGLPSALIIEFRVVPIIEKGSPIAMILPYAIA